MTAFRSRRARAIRRKIIAGTTTTTALLLASCVAPPAAPPPAPVPRPAPAPTPTPTPPPVAQNWEDWPFTPGDWAYSVNGGQGSVATFAAPDGAALFTIRCDKAAGQVRIARSGALAAGSGQMTVRTTFGALAWPAQGMAGPPAQVVASRSSNDMALDQLAYTRGRFSVEMSGLPTLVLRAWAEPQRVIEDCRS